MSSLDLEYLSMVLEKAINDLQSANNIDIISTIKSDVIGKNGIITSAFKLIGGLEKVDRAVFGAKLNALKKKFDAAYCIACEKLTSKNAIPTQFCDVTLPGRGVFLGGLHPVTLVSHRLISILNMMGFSYVSGKEIETDYYNFTALNIPEKHPARAMQDTFYLDSDYLLRTHTSAVQIRYGEKHKPPMRIFSLGKVFRVDMDATHVPMFHQIEGFWIDKNINFANMRFLLTRLIQLFFNDSSLRLRLRASFFPFTEPSAEGDIFDGNNWLEVFGCGVVNVNVLQNINIDPKEYQGIAFGIGVERLAMLYYGINDVRDCYTSNLEFLKQFGGII